MSYRVAFIGMGAIAQDVKHELADLFEAIGAELFVLRRQQHTLADLLDFAPHCSK